MNAKKWYQSKTIWANVLGGAATIAGVFGLDLGLTPEAQAQIVAGVLALINVVLRLVTKTAIGE